MDTAAAFGKALRELRKAKMMSQEDFSDVCSQVYMSQLERGLKSPTLGMVDDLAARLGVHPLTLLFKAYATQAEVENINPEQLMLKIMQEIQTKIENK
ncbi:MAG: helix-turn-helix transcriptional regulator [Proteobacteria bacterium]|nr:helix-turn-helix transcriptional regulator [Pseudomonadota bacterium]